MVEANDPARAGQLASEKEVFGGRYAVAAVHTRFDRVQWFVWDAERQFCDLPEVIRQADSREEALAGFCESCGEMVDLDIWSLVPDRCDNCEVIRS